MKERGEGKERTEGGRKEGKESEHMHTLLIGWLNVFLATDLQGGFFLSSRILQWILFASCSL